jgi:hypothetical protein
LFENGILRKAFGPKVDEVPGEWRRLQNAELYKEGVGPSKHD